MNILIDIEARIIEILNILVPLTIDDIIEDFPFIKNTKQVRQFYLEIDNLLESQKVQPLSTFKKVLNNPQTLVQIKQIISSCIFRFIENKFLCHQFMHSPNSMVLQAHTFINALSSIIKCKESDEQFQFKSSIIQIYLKLLLWVNGNGKETILKMISQAGYYFKIGRNNLGVMFTEKVFSSFILDSIQKTKNGYDFICGQIFECLIIPQIEITLCYFQKLTQRYSKLIGQSLLLTLDLTTQIINNEKLLKSHLQLLFQSQKLEQIITSGWKFTIDYIESNFDDDQKQNIIDLVVCLANSILSVILKEKWFKKTSKLIKVITQIGSYIWDICIDQPYSRYARIFINFQLDNSYLTSIKQSSVSIVMNMLQIGKQVAMNKQCNNNFFGSTEYVVTTFVVPICKQLLKEIQKHIQNEHLDLEFVNSIVLLCSGSQEQQSLLISQQSELLIVALLKIVKKLAQNFADFQGMVKIMISNCLELNYQQTQLLEKHFKGKVEEIGMLLSSLLYPLLGKDLDWINYIEDFTFKNISKQKSQTSEFLLFLQLRVFMEDFIFQSSPPNGFIDNLIKKYTEANKYVSKTLMYLSVDILTFYFKTFRLPYQKEQTRIQNVLNMKIMVDTLKLQMSVIMVYCQSIDDDSIVKWMRNIFYSNILQKMHEETSTEIMTFVLRIIGKLMNYSEQKNKFQLVKAIFGMLLNHIFDQCQSTDLQVSNALKLMNLTMKTFKNTKNQTSLYRSKIQEIYQFMVNQFTDLLHKVRFTQEIQMIYQKMRIVESDISLNLLFLHFQITKPDNVSFIFQKCLEGIEKESFEFRQNIMHLVLLHRAMLKFPQTITANYVKRMLRIVLFQANLQRKNKSLSTGLSYFYTGKVYLLFIVLLKVAPQCLYQEIWSLLSSEDQVGDKIENQYKNIVSEVFLNANNYMVHYDIPLLVRILMGILNQMVVSNSQFPMCHRKYCHLYLKLLIEAVQRLNNLKENKNDVWSNPKENQEQVEYQEHFIHMQSHFRLICELIQETNWDEENQAKTLKVINIEFTELFFLLNERKKLWTEDVLSKFVKPESICHLLKGKKSGEQRIIFKVDRNIQ